MIWGNCTVTQRNIYNQVKRKAGYKNTGVLSLQLGSALIVKASKGINVTFYGT